MVVAMMPSDGGRRPLRRGFAPRARAPGAGSGMRADRRAAAAASWPAAGSGVDP